MGVSKNNGTPKSSILIGFFIINHPFWGTPIFGNIQIDLYKTKTSSLCMISTEQLLFANYHFQLHPKFHLTLWPPNEICPVPPIQRCFQRLWRRWRHNLAGRILTCYIGTMDAHSFFNTCNFAWRNREAKEHLSIDISWQGIVPSQLCWWFETAIGSMPTRHSSDCHPWAPRHSME